MNYSLFTDLYELTMAQGYFLLGRKDESASFDYFFRKIPFGGGFVVFAGLQQLLEILESFRFETDEINYLRRIGFNSDFLEYLSNFKFEGELFSMKEGEIVFPNEPLVRVEGNLIETQIVETLLLNILNFQSLIATKSKRVCIAAGGKTVLDFGMRRAQGLGAIWGSRAAIIGGVKATSNVYSAMRYNLSPSGTMAHSWVESFDSELEAFREFANIYGGNSILLLDTYNTLDSGLPNAIKVAREMETKGEKLKGIRLDSGDLAYLSKEVRQRLDSEGLSYVKIAVSNQLDEYIIRSLEEQNAAIDYYGVGTKLATGFPDGALDGVYKICEISQRPTMKFSDNIAKTTLPGKKKVFRYFSGNMFYGDAVVLDNEEIVDKFYNPFFPDKFKLVEGLKFEPLLQKVFSKGRMLVKSGSIEEIAEYTDSRLELLSPEIKRFDYPHLYKVGVSKNLLSLRDKLRSFY